MAVVTQIQIRRGTASQWTSTNPTLAAGEQGFETDTGKFKIGTGSTAWTSLAYAAGTGTVTSITAGTGLSGGTITTSGTIAIDTATTADLTTAQTLTNKTLTTPVITNPKITLTYSAKTAAYTAVSGDEGGVFSMNNASSIQFNIPTDATFNFAIGTQFNVFWITGAGQPTIGAVTPGTTTVISTGATSATPKLRVANSMATVLKIAANSWIVIGDIA
jgi:hypothetical protein